MGGLGNYLRPCVWYPANSPRVRDPSFPKTDTREPPSESSRCWANVTETLSGSRTVPGNGNVFRPESGIRVATVPPPSRNTRHNRTRRETATDSVRNTPKWSGHTRSGSMLTTERWGSIKIGFLCPGFRWFCPDLCLVCFSLFCWSCALQTSVWIPCGFRVDSVWIPCGFRVDSVWIPCVWIPCGFRVDSVWIPHRVDPCGFRVDPCRVDSVPFSLGIPRRFCRWECEESTVFDEGSLDGLGNFR